MEINSLISKIYPTVHPFEGVNSIEKKLFEEKYLVVMNDDDEFQGILTVFDLAKRPHKIVIDCMTGKESVSDNETIISILDKFIKNDCSALPVFHENEFIGIIEKKDLINDFRNKIDKLCNEAAISHNIESSFLSNLSHEIRTPLNGLLGFLDLISDLDIEGIKTAGKAYYKIIQESADRFLLVMENLIDLSLIDSGHDIEIEKEKVWIESILSYLKKYFQSSTSLYNRDLSVHYVNPDTSLVIFSDGKKIKQILYNLIDIALRISNDGNVILGYKIENQNIVFYVTNKGSQINEDKKKKVFEVLEKQDTGSYEYVSGLGIGLPLVKKLSELLEGNVYFEANENQTSFFCAIPLIV